jgi:hypothetical protein
MNTPSNSSRQPTNGTSSRNGNAPNGLARSTDRRRRPQPSSSDEYLRALPMLATGLDGVVVYSNPAFATMLGHGTDVRLAGYGLPALLDGHTATPPRDCVAALRAANNAIVDWHHSEGFPVRSVVSESLYIRATDQILLFGVTDLTELLWTAPPDSHWAP